jgi:predicted TIM-barrel fold metal-dependent hydrolase
LNFGPVHRRANTKIVGVKLHPALGNYDVLSPDVFRLMDDAVGPSGLPVISHTGNDSPNVPIGRFLELAARFPDIRFIAAHLGIGFLGPPRHGCQRVAQPSLFKRVVRYGDAARLLHGRCGDVARSGWG